MSAVLITKARNGFIVQPFSAQPGFQTDLTTVSVYAEGQEAAIGEALKGLLAPPLVPSFRQDLSAAAAALEIPPTTI